MPKSNRSARPAKQYKLDAMSITILLVMAIFGGIVGYYIGVSSGASQMLDSFQTTQMTQGK